MFQKLALLPSSGKKSAYFPRSYFKNRQWTKSKKYDVSELYTIVKALWILFKSNGFPAFKFYAKEPQYFFAGGSTFTKGNMLQTTLETWSSEELCSVIQFYWQNMYFPHWNLLGDKRCMLMAYWDCNMTESSAVCLEMVGYKLLQLL